MTTDRLRHTIHAADQALADGRPRDAVPVFDALLAEGGWAADVHQALLHNLATALKRVAAAEIAAGDPAVVGTAQRVVDLEVPAGLPPDRLRQRALIVQSLGTDFMDAGHLDQAAVCMRKAVALYPCPSFANNLILTLDKLGRPSVLRDYCDGLAPKDLAPRVLFACQPKSGSTFLRNVLVEATGFRDLYLCHHTELASQDLSYPILLEFATAPTVTHQHCRATPANVQLMQAFGVRPVVLVRNLYDVVVSLRDFYTTGAVRGTAFDPQVWAGLTPDRQLDQVIDLVVPWHLDFLAGWQRAAATGRVPVLWLTYEEMVADKPAAVRRVLDFYRLTVSDERVSAALTTVEGRPEKNRFNKGVSGRGRAGLTDDQKARVRRLANYYPTTDFTSYGLD